MSRLVRNGVPVDHDATPSDQATVRLAREGIVLPGKPEWEQMPLPEDLTSISDEDLIELFVRVSAWTGYLATRAAAAMVDERAAEIALEVQEARTLIEGWGGTNKDRVTIAKAERAINADVQRLRKVLEERYSYRKLLEVLSGNSERNGNLVSRELTRRTSGPAPERRAHRFHN